MQSASSINIVKETHDIHKCSNSPCNQALSQASRLKIYNTPASPVLFQKLTSPFFQRHHFQPWKRRSRLLLLKLIF